MHLSECAGEKDIRGRDLLQPHLLEEGIRVGLATHKIAEELVVGGAGFINHASRARIENAELGAWGVEFGAGFFVPVGYGSILTDSSVEPSSRLTINALSCCKA